MTFETSIALQQKEKIALKCVNLFNFHCLSFIWTLFSSHDDETAFSGITRNNIFMVPLSRQSLPHWYALPQKQYTRLRKIVQKYCEQYINIRLWPFFEGLTSSDVLIFIVKVNLSVLYQAVYLSRSIRPNKYPKTDAEPGCFTNFSLSGDL